MKDGHIIVIGAGITGLASAAALSKRGRKVTVLEASERPGGRIRRLTRHGDSVEVGAQGIHSNYTEMLSLINQVGLQSELMPLQGKVSFLDRSGSLRIPDRDLGVIKLMNARGVRNFSWFAARYIAFAKRFPQFEISRDIPSYDDVSAEDAFSWAGDDFHDFLLRPMMHAMTNTTLSDTSLYHAINSMRLALSTKVFGLRTGIVTLAERLASSVSVQYSNSAAQILTTGARVDGVLLEDGRILKCDHVIVACPIEAAAKILPDELSVAKEFLYECPSAPFVLVYFFLDRPVSSEAYVYMGHPYRDVVFNMAINHSRKAPYMVPSGKAIISAWSSYPSSTNLFFQTDDAVVSQALRDMEAFFPGISGWVDEARVIRHSWGIARYVPGAYRKILEFKRHAQTLEGISFAGNDYDGVHMEAGVRSGQRAARRACEG
ncbi:FAD-dependent oxidoreductase [Pseudomonas carnis]|uniref:protoporphyrinogen/coproporphyrinogen oxidase n=1 Tax=Pseudomonas TaxID=286 RepID=UPI00123F94F2|nr:MULTISPECIES: FAD-dependent oxidoreductase [Pseudomonas]VVN97832.1 hypothetical protein PS708_02399 [Pseudomonas fluorescens]MCR8662940.1 FAD-dependent oxidoreductase [Pseudomonas carnis]MDI3251130.1 FAD-dependent oxidoreductase [Pseudomonas sp. AL10]MDI3267213.1 FAD-dependent oxidoreductase [Pseudomonas sp. AL15]VVO40592.1 hypothetical protein PS706_05838 [Pseudomonas fluorescens]